MELLELKFRFGAGTARLYPVVAGHNDPMWSYEYPCEARAGCYFLTESRDTERHFDTQGRGLGARASACRLFVVHFWREGCSSRCWNHPGLSDPVRFRLEGGAQSCGLRRLR